ncbi:LysM peptidoglycan-binding domain-containing protein [Bacillus sp. FJAT-49736]|uniref:cell division suppressor protein YneA n=1 Tax=Bacillus sp. FJAT-49736 TaxID=2833582 RepID=UPI001BCA5919|nr:LysM peptidoglycan-binding domain-containing protein [Bacillus sp. FJAT-49736]MBS4172617.1 LysM peptidoglycan-binding domain-containing protein [Bacillus sp. FJAT-49736]
MLLLWKKYSYAIILLVLSFILGFFMILQLEDHSKDYEHITVSEGQTLWEIADMYKIKNGMSHTEFIKWVQDENGLGSTDIKEGQSIVIPIKIKDKVENVQQLASDAK